MKEIPLTKGKVAIVDDGDFERVNRLKWHLHAGGYAGCKDWSGGNRTYVYMHRLILNAPRGTEVDHINGNKLDNRRSNLRMATRKENSRNGKGMPARKSQYKGISFYDNAYHVRVMLDGKQMNFGRYKSEHLAAKVYDYAALGLHREFSRLNFPDEPMLTEDEFYSLILPKSVSSILYGPDAISQLELKS